MHYVGAGFSLPVIAMLKNSHIASNKLLSAMLAKKRVPHLLLFVGAQNAFQMAHSFAKEWMHEEAKNGFTLQYRDLHILSCEGKSGMHSIASIREMIEMALLAPFESVRKAFIIKDAERMLATSANALLKIIEEPPPHTLFILVVAKREKLLPTIVSRAQEVRFGSDAKEAVSSDYTKLFSILEVMPINFVELSDCLQEIQAAFDKKKKALEKEVNHYSQEMLKEMSAIQRQKVELEIEGMVATRFMAEVEALLLAIGSFYRTKEVDLEKVSKALSFAKLAIERSTPIKNALESLIMSC